MANLLVLIVVFLSGSIPSISQQYLFVDELLSNNEGEARCQTLYGTSLASIHSASDNLEAQTLCVPQAGDTRPGCQIGLNDFVNEAFTNGNNFVWTDGTALNYQNWASGEPNDWYRPNGEEDWVYLQKSDGKWRDELNGRTFRLLCNFGTLTNPTVGPTETPPAPSDEPTVDPSKMPSLAPSDQPTLSPSSIPTVAPSKMPSSAPTSKTPTTSPTSPPSSIPTTVTTQDPTEAPTDETTVVPTQAPAKGPIDEPTVAPTQDPTITGAEAEVDEQTTESKEDDDSDGDNDSMTVSSWRNVNAQIMLIAIGVCILFCMILLSCLCITRLKQQRVLKQQMVHIEADINRFRQTVASTLSSAVEPEGENTGVNKPGIRMNRPNEDLARILKVVQQNHVHPLVPPPVPVPLLQDGLQAQTTGAAGNDDYYYEQEDAVDAYNEEEIQEKDESDSNDSMYDNNDGMQQTAGYDDGMQQTAGYDDGMQ